MLVVNLPHNLTFVSSAPGDRNMYIIIQKHAITKIPDFTIIIIISIRFAFVQCIKSTVSYCNSQGTMRVWVYALQESLYSLTPSQTNHLIPLLELRE